jgi:hypothetical protein
MQSILDSKLQTFSFFSWVDNYKLSIAVRNPENDPFGIGPESWQEGTYLDCMLRAYAYSSDSLTPPYATFERPTNINVERLTLLQVLSTSNLMEIGKYSVKINYRAYRSYKL